jgi:subtilisin family serine protease
LTKDALEDYSLQGPTLDGRTKPDLVAPTGEIFPADGYKDGFYGTSGSAPIVAGAAPVFQRFPSMSATDVKAYLIRNVVDLSVPDPDNKFGAGRLALPNPSFDKRNNPTPAETKTP